MGLYLHIPFCTKACTYCDFHFSTTTKDQTPLLDAMRKELIGRRPIVGDPTLGTIYFGGGTPSLLHPQEIASFIELARSMFKVPVDAEITVEANPDDVTTEVLQRWRSAGVSRVSLGIQSFRDDRLKWMGRAHNASDALRAIDQVAKAGFASWTVDLIYGLPGMTIAEWDEQLAIALSHGMPHLSAYCLTVEGATVLAHQVRKGAVSLPTDGEQGEQFDHLADRMETAGLYRYEVSNFGREGHIAVHNTNYWRGVPYIGIGPSAHSFDGTARRRNVANNARYVRAIAQGGAFWEEEVLTHAQRVNERLMTGLRTKWGVDLRTLGDDVLIRERRTIERYLGSGDLQVRDGHLLLTPKGMRYADRIASDLFLL